MSKFNELDLECEENIDSENQIKNINDSNNGVFDYIDEESEEDLNKSSKILDAFLNDNKTKFQNVEDFNIKNNLEKMGLNYSKEDLDQLKLDYNFVEDNDKIDLGE